MWTVQVRKENEILPLSAIDAVEVGTKLGTGTLVGASNELSVTGVVFALGNNVFIFLGVSTITSCFSF